MRVVLVPSALAAYIVGDIVSGLATAKHSDAARGGASAVFVAAWLAHGAAMIHGMTM
jgi:hypothetical protein